MDQEVAGIWRPLAVSSRAQHSCQVALQPDLQSVAIGLEQDCFNQSSDGLSRACAALLALQRKTEVPNLLPIDVGHARVQQLRHLWSLKTGLQFGLSGFEREELVLDGQRRDAVFDGLDEFPDLALDCRELLATVRHTGAVLHAQPIQLAHVLAAEILEQVPAHQLVAERHEHPLLHFLAADGQTVRAGATGSRAKAREAIPPIHHVPAAALSAFRQTGEEILRTPSLIESLRIAARCDAAHLCLPRLHPVPELIVHDSLLGNGSRHPIGWWIPSRNTLPRVRILHVAQAIPHEAPDVQLVVQDSCAAGRIAVDGTGIPRCATRSGTTFRIQSLGERFWREASCIVAEDPADHFRFRRNDLAIAGCGYAIGPCARHLVAIAETASGLSDFDATAQSPACLVCKVLEEERVHRALQADVQVRDVAFGECHDVHAGESEGLEETGGVFLVAAESIQRLREHDIESLVQRVSHQCLEAGPKQRGTRYRDR